MAEKRDHECPNCHKNEWELKTRQNKSGTGTPSGDVWNTADVQEWFCPCGYRERKED
jgi:hypothetical protein